MSRSTRVALTAAGALAVAAVGAGAGAGIYAAVSPTKTKTVVSSVTTVEHAQPVSSSVPGLSVNAIYKRTYQGVVDITVTSSHGVGAFGSQASSAEGSGFVFDRRGDI